MKNPATSGTSGQESAADEYLRTAEVAHLLHVSPKTITRWASEGKLPSVRTLGGHRRFPGKPIRELAQRLAEDSFGGMAMESSQS